MRRMNFLFNINVCRVCMQNEQSVDLCSDSKLQQMFTYTTRLTLSEKDNLPKSLCSNCMMRLKIAHKFIINAHDSENNLKQFLAKISNEFKEVAQGNKNEIATDNNTDVDDADHLSDTEMISLMRDDDDQPTNSKKSNDYSLKSKEKRKNSNVNENDQKKSKSANTGKATIATHEENDKTDVNMPFNQPSPHKIKLNAVYALSEDILLIHTDNNEIELESVTNFEYQDEHSQEQTEEEEEQQKANEDMDEQDNDQEQDQLLDDNENPEDNNAHTVDVFSLNDDGSLNNIHELTELNMEENRLESLHDNTSDIQNLVSSSQVGYLREYETMLSNQVNVLPYNDDYIEENSIEEEIHLVEDLANEHVVETLAKNVHERQSGKSNSVPVAFSAPGRQKNEIISKVTSRKAAQPQPMPSHTQATLNRFFCEKCNRDFSTKTNLNRHMQSHEGNKPHACPECSKTFSQKSSLKMHMYTHTGEKPYVCDVCNRGFTQCKSLIFHLRRHTGEKPFQCEYCLVMFRQKDALRSSSEQHTSQVRKKINDLGNDYLEERMREFIENYKSITLEYKK